MNITGLGIIASIVLTILKLAGVDPIAAWSWWLVAAPTLAAFGVSVVILFFVGMLAGILFD
ncbi:hypothetical protein [Mycolicibacterium palauense]|uniref:hypothetical protein n=1 Tax=Mycolicibacterium palauense TaxID=2034511 RepID=UPI000BFEEEE7|nr:hypothetical protein [Mycolicibacterium palauense]